MPRQRHGNTVLLKPKTTKTTPSYIGMVGHGVQTITKTLTRVHKGRSLRAKQGKRKWIFVTPFLQIIWTNQNSDWFNFFQLTWAQTWDCSYETHFHGYDNLAYFNLSGAIFSMAYDSSHLTTYHSSFQTRINPITRLLPLFQRQHPTPIMITKRCLPRTVIRALRALL